MCRASAVWAYLVTVGFGDVGSVNGAADALEDDEDWMERRAEGYAGLDATALSAWPERTATLDSIAGQVGFGLCRVPCLSSVLLPLPPVLAIFLLRHVVPTMYCDLGS